MNDYRKSVNLPNWEKYPPAGGPMSVVWKASSSDRAAGTAPQQVGHGADLTQI